MPLLPLTDNITRLPMATWADESLLPRRGSRSTRRPTGTYTVSLVDVATWFDPRRNKLLGRFGSNMRSDLVRLLFDVYGNEEFFFTEYLPNACQRHPGNHPQRFEWALRLFRRLYNDGVAIWKLMLCTHIGETSSNHMLLTVPSAFHAFGSSEKEFSIEASSFSISKNYSDDEYNTIRQRFLTHTDGLAQWLDSDDLSTTAHPNYQTIPGLILSFWRKSLATADLFVDGSVSSFYNCRETIDDTPDEPFSFVTVPTFTIITTSMGNPKYSTGSNASKSHLWRQFNYSTNVLEVTGVSAKRLPKEAPEVPLYGIELEVSTDYTPKHLVNAVSDIFLICKQDSSISGSKAERHELVTVPASYRTHRALWAEFFSNLDMSKFDTTKETNNGLHIHIGREFFDGSAHIRKFCWFFTRPDHYDFMLKFSERDVTSLNNYSPMPSYDSSRSYTRNLLNSQTACNARRGTVNLSKSATIEVRLFRGIVSFAEVMKDLEFVDAALEFTRHASYNSLDLGSFFDYLNKTPRSKYLVLKQYLSKINSSEYKNGVLLNKMIQTERFEYVVEYFRKNPNLMTLGILKSLWTRHPNMDFDYNFKTQEFTIKKNINGSSVSELDSLAHRIAKKTGKVAA